jgi:hypothetical protein
MFRKNPHALVDTTTCAQPGKVDSAANCYTCLSPWAWLHMLAVWAMSTPKQGGLTNHRHKSACVELLGSYIHVICANSDLVLDIALLKEWKPCWPRPHSCPHSVTIKIGKTWIVDISAWAESNKVADKGSCGYIWLTALRLELGFDTEWHALELFIATMSIPSLRGLHAQLLWHLGWHFQSLCLNGFSKPKLKLHEMVVQRLDLEGSLRLPQQLDRQLVRYVVSGRQATDQQFLSCCTDKASVVGMSLQSTVIVTTTNLGVYAPPAVRPHFW